MEEFIGLQDKNGREIREGDTVTNGKAAFEVVWKNYAWYLERSVGDYHKFVYEMAEIIREKYWVI